MRISGAAFRSLANSSHPVRSTLLLQLATQKQLTKAREEAARTRQRLKNVEGVLEAESSRGARA